MCIATTTITATTMIAVPLQMTSRWPIVPEMVGHGPPCQAEAAISGIAMTSPTAPQSAQPDHSARVTSPNAACQRRATASDSPDPVSYAAGASATCAGYDGG